MPRSIENTTHPTNPYAGGTLNVLGGAFMTASQPFVYGIVSLIEAVERMVAWFAVRRERRRTVALLARLDDRTLADIGLERAQIQSMVVRPQRAANENRSGLAA